MSHVPWLGCPGVDGKAGKYFALVSALDCGLDRCIIIIDSLFSLYLNIFVSHISVFHLRF